MWVITMLEISGNDSKEIQRVIENRLINHTNNIFVLDNIVCIRRICIFLRISLYNRLWK